MRLGSDSLRCSPDKENLPFLVPTLTLPCRLNSQIAERQITARISGKDSPAMDLYPTQASIWLGRLGSRFQYT